MSQVDAKTGEVQDASVCVNEPLEEESADGVPGCGYLVTADDLSAVRSVRTSAKECA